VYIQDVCGLDCSTIRIGLQVAVTERDTLFAVSDLHRPVMQLLRARGPGVELGEKDSPHKARVVILSCRGYRAL
jgi:hypothetical protein